MISFKEPELADREWMVECLSHALSLNCEYTFGNIYVWRTAYVTRVCHYKDFLLIRYGRGNDVGYSPPIGTGDYKDACLQIFEDAKACGVKPRFLGVTDIYRNLFELHFPGMFSYEYNEGYNDYIYDINKMASLSGKKYHGKRNHIAFFKKTYPDWKFETISKDNINECIELHTNWIEEKSEDDEADYSFEFEAVLSAFENYDALCFTGGLIRAEGKVIAYTMGERHSKACFVTHFEKAPAEIRGAFPTINQEFTKKCLMSYEFVNREEDLGIPGLRKAKQSYHPEIFLEKCVAVYEG